MDSLARVHPGWDRYVLLADRRDGRFELDGEAFATIEIENLSIQSKYQLLFQYTLLEMSTAAKPWLMTRLFDDGYDRVVYFDPDILVYAPLDELDHAWSRGTLAVLTPHLTGRLLDHKYPGERDILLSGTYNLGFIALARHAALESFLDYWREKSLAAFAVDIKEGLFTDQKWVDPVPGMFPDVHVLRHDGYNVAYWNLPHRHVTRVASGFEVNGQPLVFFHFSGLDPLQPEGLSRHQDRLTLADIGDAAALVQSYCAMVRHAGYDECRDWPYAFDCFDDGTPILPAMRSWYRGDVQLQQMAGTNPFRPGALDFNQVVAAGTSTRPPITRLMDAIYAARPDVKDAFRDIRGRDRVAFAQWFVTHGASQHEIPAKYVESVAGALTPLGPALTAGGPALAGDLLWLARLFDPRSWRDRLTGIVSRSRRGAVVNGRTAAHRRFDVDVSGFWPQTDEDRLQGMTWMAPHATVRLGIRADHADVVTIAGEHSPTLHRKAGNPGTLRMTVTLDGRAIATDRVIRGGLFRLTIPLPPRSESDSHAEILGICCDGAFVPAAMGMGSDVRTLSVRVKEVRIGDRAILDFSRYPRVHQPTSEPAVPAFNIIGHSTVASGVGHSARLCALSAEAAGLQAHAVDCGEVVEQAALRFRRIEAPGRVNVIHVNADQVPSVAALFGPAYLRDRYNVGVWHWELGEFPDCWLESFAPLQEIWAPSQFILRAVGAKSPIPVVHMPHGVDVPTVGRASRSDFGLPTDRVLFLLMYDMRSFQARKNPEAAIDSFARAFPNGRDAALVLKVANGAANPDDLARLQSRCRDTPGTILIDDAYPIDRVHQLQSVCDGYVSLHRAEGFGFNLAESMLLGKPVIATGWSGNMDFMNAENACLVNYALTPIATDVGPYRSGQIWAEPDVEHAAWHMTRLAADASLRESIGRAAAAHLSAHFSCRVAGERMRERLRVIGRMCPPAGASATRGAAR